MLAFSGSAIDRRTRPLKSRFCSCPRNERCCLGWRGIDVTPISARLRLVLTSTIDFQNPQMIDRASERYGSTQCCVDCGRNLPVCGFWRSVIHRKLPHPSSRRIPCARKSRRSSQSVSRVGNVLTKYGRQNSPSGQPQSSSSWRLGDGLTPRVPSLRGRLSRYQHVHLLNPTNG